MLSDINQWIAEHQALAITFGLPVFTVFLGFWGSYLAHKSKSDEIRLTARARLSEYRKDNFDRLQSEIANLQSLMAIMIRESVLKEEDGSSISLTNDDLQNMMQTAENIMLRMRASEDLVDSFSDKFSILFNHLNGGENEDDGEEWIALRKVCHDILRIEWLQLENELKRLQ